MTQQGTLQFDLFEDLLNAYAGGLPRSNAAVYADLSRRRDIPAEAWSARTPIGRSGELHSPLKRQVRWYQQTLKTLGLLERDGTARGVWRLTPQGEKKLTPAPAGRVLLGFSTNLGIALWGSCEDAIPALDQPVHLVLSSLPYPLNVPRAYGNPTEQEYVDWVCRILEPLMGKLARGASVVLNVGNDVFMKGSPARSLYRERMVIALHDRLGLQKMDEWPWINKARPPGPLRYASLTRQQLNASWEPFYWFSADPENVAANNRRVLVPHSEKHLQLIARGGEARSTSYGDGAHRVRPGSYGEATAGKIPRNFFEMPHNCTDKVELAKLARAAGLPVHGATMPLKLAEFVIEYLTERDQMVVDTCSGWFRTAKAAEKLGRRWFCTEKMGEYVLGGALGFKDFPGFQMHGGLAGRELAHAF